MKWIAIGAAVVAVVGMAAVFAFANDMRGSVDMDVYKVHGGDKPQPSP